MANVREIGETVAMFELGGPLGPDEFSAYLRQLDVSIAGGRPFAMVVDGSHPALELATQPNKRWQLTRAAAIGQLHRGIAFVTGTMTRERVQALYALQPPGVPYAFFSDRDEAIEWARAAIDGDRKATLEDRKTVQMPSIR
jgi:hypothetical protein